MRRKGFFVGVVAALVLGAAGVARADDATDEMQKLRQQIEKVLGLMKENEKALLAASTGQAATPTKPDVPKPEVPPAKDAEPKATGPKIARELKELVDMWPT